MMRSVFGLAAVAVSLVLASAASAATITVTSTADAGTGSLRAAVTAANAGDTIVLPASSSPYAVSSGEIQITEPITIKGAGPTSSVIKGNGSSRVFEVTNAVTGTSAVRFEGVGITGGAATTEPGGGGILVDSAVLDVVDSSITLNTAGTAGQPLPATADDDGGAGIYSDGTSVSVSESTISDNTVVISGGHCCQGGGGIYENNGPITVVDSVLDGNSASAISNTGGSNNDDDGGGAIHNEESDIAVTASVLDNNSTTVKDLGGAPGNTCCQGGGALYSDGGDITVATSTLSANTATLTGTSGTSSFCCEGGGAIYQDNQDTTLIGTTLSDNTATFSSTGTPPTDSGGGAIYIDTGNDPFDVVNSTISGNTTNISGTDDGGGGVFFDAGNPGPLTLANATVVGNSASAAPGGGIYADGNTVTAQNSIVASNTAANGGKDCDGSSPTFTSMGYNLEDSPDSCSFTATGDQVVPAANLHLGSLANNGGPTMTVALLAGSPAIDAGNPAGCFDSSGDPLATDQRGLPRPVGLTCDIGAYEFSPPTVISAPQVLGVAQVGQRLFCAPGSFGGTPAHSLSYQWDRNGAAIGGAGGQTYLAAAADGGKKLTCVETDNSGDGSTAATSTSVTVAALPAAFGSSPLVTLSISHGVIKLPAGGSHASISIKNANGFTVTGTIGAGLPAFGVASAASASVTRFSLPAHSTRKVKLGFSKALLKRVPKSGRLVIQLSLKLTDPAHHKLTVSGTYLLERAKAHTKKKKK
jgi:hypothetical protein